MSLMFLVDFRIASGIAKEGVSNLSQKVMLTLALHGKIDHAECTVEEAEGPNSVHSVLVVCGVTAKGDDVIANNSSDCTQVTATLDFCSIYSTLYNIRYNQ